METFDLIEMQHKAKEIFDPRKLYELWEEICKRYEAKEIGEYELEEMKEVIWPNLRQLSALQRVVNDQPVSEKPKTEKGRVA